MTNHALKDIKNKFTEYVIRFVIGGEKMHPLLRLKLDHSHRVATEARRISGALDWPAQEQNTAEIIGLLHDIGRFSQFREFGTFSDGHALDHGQIGWEVLQKENLLDDMNAEDQENIRCLGDFLLMQMNWVYDLNFVVTTQLVLDRDILPSLDKHIDNRPDIKTLTSKIKQDALNTVKQYRAKV